MEEGGRIVLLTFAALCFAIGWQFVPCLCSFWNYAVVRSDGLQHNCVRKMQNKIKQNKIVKCFNKTTESRKWKFNWIKPHKNGRIKGYK